jgi:hypothetical protein
MSVSCCICETRIREGVIFDEKAYCMSCLSEHMKPKCGKCHTSEDTGYYHSNYGKICYNCLHFGSGGGYLYDNDGH